MQQPLPSNTAPPGFGRVINIIAVCLLPGLLSNACRAPDIKPAAAGIGGIRTVLVVPAESPPLEVIPDLLVRQTPAYQHYRNMALAFPLPEKCYRTPGGIAVAGLFSPDDAAQTPLPNPGPARAGELVPREPADWTPGRAAAQQAPRLLSARNIDAVLGGRYLRLPLPAGRNCTSLGQWHNAIVQWYGQAHTSAAYGRRGEFDAVLELAIDKYRIFESQTSLQVLIKLVDPASGRVIARGRADSFTVGDAAPNSLHRDGAAFKQLIAGMAGELLEQSLEAAGLEPAASPAR